MKRLLCALMVFFSVNCVASQHIDVDKGDMTDQQVAEINSFIAKKKQESLTATSTSETVRNEVNEWSALGTNIGKSMVATAKEVGVAAVDFAKTPLGQIVTVIIVWKVIGHSMLMIFLGVLSTLVCITAVRRMYAKATTESIKYEYVPMWKGLWTRRVVTERRNASPSEGEWLAMWVTSAVGTLVTIVSFLQA